MEEPRKIAFHIPVLRARVVRESCITPFMFRISSFECIATATRFLYLSFSSRKTFLSRCWNAMNKWYLYYISSVGKNYLFLFFYARKNAFVEMNISRESASSSRLCPREGILGDSLRRTTRRCDRTARRKRASWRRRSFSTANCTRRDVT